MAINRLLSVLLLAFFNIFIQAAYAANSINWSIATTSFPHDQSLGDTGHEKTPAGYVDLPTGNLVFDIPEVSVKGQRGLDFILSRSYGKVNNGFRSMGNWDLEVPRLVMMTGPSTKLQGDTLAGGICENNGDTSTSNNANGSPSFNSSLLDGRYKKEVTTSYMQLANDTLLKSLMGALQYMSASQSGVSQQNYNSNKTKAQSIKNIIDRSAVSGNIINENDFGNYENYINYLIQENDISALEANINITQFSLDSAFKLYTGIGIQIKYPNGSYSQVFKAINGVSSSTAASRVINALDSSFLTSQSGGTIIYVNSSNQPTTYWKNPKTGEVTYLPDLTPLGYTVVYAKSLIALMDNPISHWSIQKNTTTSIFSLFTDVDNRLRPISLYLPAQKNRTFYPLKGDPITLGYPNNAKYISQDNWFISCGVGSNKGFTVHAANGVKYSFPETNRENQTGYPTIFSGQSIPGRVSVFASKIESQYGEGYQLDYLNTINSNLVYSGYNNTNKFLLKNVKSVIDGSMNDQNLLELNYVKTNSAGNEFPEADFATKSGDIVLKQIKRRVNGRLISWTSYVYGGQEPAAAAYKLADKLVSGETVGEFQDASQAQFYLKSAGYSTGDAISYSYGGPYRLVGNATLDTNGITSQEFVWFYSDLTGAKYYKASKNTSSPLVLANQAAWTYTLNTFARAGYAEEKSYRVSESNWSGSNLSPYQVKYSYTNRNASNIQTTTVNSKDTDRGESKEHVYSYFSYEKGLADSYKHGLLDNVKQGDRTERYEWTTVGTAFGQTPSTTLNDYQNYQDVSLVRMSKRTVSHLGSYSTVLSDFDLYGNAKTTKETGLNGSTTVSRTGTLDYFNSGTASGDSSAQPWLVGLPKSLKYGTLAVFNTTYDLLGSVISDSRQGVSSQYSYESVSFMSCVNALAEFEWSAFLSCTGSYMADEIHTGLAYKQDVGGGELITYYSQYQYGLPTQVQLPNNATQTMAVNDFGQVTQSTDADGVTSRKVYDDTGRVQEDHPTDGLAYTHYDYDGLNITSTIKNTGSTDHVVLQTLNGEGQMISQKETSGSRSVYTQKTIDSFGRVRFQSYPSTSQDSTAGTTSKYDEFDRAILINDGGAVTTLCYQSCGDNTGAVGSISDDYGTTVQQYYSLGDFSTGLVSSSARKGSDNSSLLSTVSYDPNYLMPKSSIKGNSQQTYTYYSSGLLRTLYDNNSASTTNTTTYTYDTAGRMKKTTHPDGSAETYSYANKQGNLPSSRVWNSQTTTYVYSNAGRSKSSSAPDVSLTFALDTYGRPYGMTQTITDGSAKRSYNLNYTYNNLGQVIRLTYPSGKSVDLSNQNSFGEVTTIPSVIQSISYNAWHQPTLVQANSDVSWSMGYDTDGKPVNLIHQAIGKCQLNLSYDYDAVKRIKSITDGCNNDQYNATFDRYGSGQLKKATLSQGIFDYTYNADDISTLKATRKQAGSLDASYTYNYINGTSKLDSITGSNYSKFIYDNMSRVTSDGLRTLSYDEYGRVKKAGTDTYLYAPDNLRVSANRQGYGKTDYVYGLSGELLYEQDLTTQLAKNYVYVAGQQVASLESFPDTDTDKDGIKDVEELEYGTKVNVYDSYIDADNDGIPDYLERYLGLDPNNRDSDGDGFSDGYEYKTLGLEAAMSNSLFPTKPEPKPVATWLAPILGLLLDDAA